MKYRIALNLLFFIFSALLFHQKSYSQCPQIESILVDACDTGSDEGFNEMVRFKVGTTAINTSSLTVNWPSNSWQGLVQNATTAFKVATLNAQISAAGGCGQLIEPTGGVLPANTKVILVSSYNFNITSNYFGAITENIYIIFQDNSTTSGGHFANYNTTSGLRTLTMIFGGGCSDSVTYQRTLLKNINGTYGPAFPDPTADALNNGATVDFTASGTATYVNNGCVAPVEVFSVDAGNSPLSACAGATISLIGAAQGQQSVGWSATSGSFSSPTTLSTNYTIDPAATGVITLTLTAKNSCGTDKTDTVIVNINSGATPIINCGSTTSSSVEFTWASVTGATGYSVFYQIGTGTPTSYVSIGNVLNYTVNSLASGENVIITVLPAGGTGTCFVSSSKTCTSNGCIAPVLNITNPTATCIPVTIDLTIPAVTAGSTGAGVLTYWKDAAATIPLLSPSAITVSGTYYIKSTSGTCTDIKPVIVVVNTIPALIITNPAAVCSPATVDITLPAVTVGSTSGTILTYWQDLMATVPLINPNAITVSGNYYIKSAFSTCSMTTFVAVTINNNAVLTITNPAAVCSPATVNIALPTVTAGSIGSGTLTYWKDAAATIVLANPTSVSIGGTYYIKMGSGACSDIKDVIVVINASPVLTITNPASICFPFTIDLTFPYVTAGSTGGGALSYWTDSAATIALVNPTAINASGTYYIKSTSGTCSDIKPVVVVVNALPYLYITNPAAVCFPATVDITSPAVTAGSVSGTALTYWKDNLATVPLINPNAISVSGVYYIKSSFPACAIATSVLATINTSPVLTITNPVAVCSPSTVDITSAPVTAGSTGLGTLSYWTNAAGTIALSNPSAIATSGTYYIKSTSGTCSDIKSVIVTVISSPVLTITNPAAVCSPATVDITSPSVTSGSTGSGILTYWTNATATSALSNPSAITSSGTYYIKSTSGTCFDIKPVIVIINNLGGLLTLFCDAANTTATSVAFDWNNITGYLGYNYSYSIAGGPPVTGSRVFPSHFDVPVSGPGISVTFTILSVAGVPCVAPASATCNSSCSSILTPDFATPIILCSGSTAPIFTSTSPNGITGTWSPAIISTTNSGNYLFTPNPILFPCATTQSINVTVVPKLTPTFTAVSPICSGKVLAPLPTTSNNAITGTWSPPLDNTVTKTYNFTPTAGQCATSTTLTISVINNVITNQRYYLCINKSGQTIAPVTIFAGLSASQYSFAWTFNGNPISVTSSFYLVNTAGIYKVTATDLSGGCTNVLIADVKESNEASATTTVGSDFNNQQQIIVTVTGGLGNYSYQLNDGLVQDSNIFSVSKGGEYVINVIDRVGCNNFRLFVNVLNYPRFFTPNNDGFNDTWNIDGLIHPEKAVIYIFDRYGKLLNQFSPLSLGWNGIYCGKELPSTDYWFTLLYQENVGENKEFKAHFSLKR
jgi:gliding motility-associated-like protein